MSELLSRVQHLTRQIISHFREALPAIDCTVYQPNLPQRKMVKHKMVTTRHTESRFTSAQTSTANRRQLCLRWKTSDLDLWTHDLENL